MRKKIQTVKLGKLLSKTKRLIKKSIVWVVLIATFLWSAGLPMTMLVPTTRAAAGEGSAVLRVDSMPGMDKITAGSYHQFEIELMVGVSGIANDGANIQVIIPSGFTPPQTTASTSAGYVTVSSTSGSAVLSATTSGQSINVTATTSALVSGDVVWVRYGDNNMGTNPSAAAQATATLGQYTFTVKTDDTGANSLTDVGALPTINIISPIKISEIEVNGGGTAGNEFVELYNNSDTAINLSGWDIAYAASSSSGSLSWTEVASSTTNTQIPAFGFFLFTSNGYSPNSVTANVSTASGALGFGSDGGYVAIRNAANTVIDYVGYGTLSDSSLPEGGAAASNPVNGSIERKAFGGSTATDMASGGIDATMGNGWDSDNNSLDFAVQASSTPQNASSTTEQPDFTNYQGDQGGGPMIMHMPLSIAPTGSSLNMLAQMGDPQTPMDQVSGELHYMIGDGSPSDNVNTDYTTLIATSSTGYFQFNVPQATIDNATTSGLYYYLKVVTTGGTSYMSASPSADMGGVEATVAQNPFTVSVVDGSGWTTNNITGAIINESSANVAGALVFLEGTGYSTTTAANGSFTLSNVQDNIYNLVMVKDGYYEGWLMDIFLSGANYDTGTTTLYAGTGGGIAGDPTKPMVMWTGPPDGMFGVPPGDSNFLIMVGFSKALDSSTFSTSTVTLSTDGVNPIAGYSVSYNPTRTSMMPPASMDPNLGIIYPPSGGFSDDTTYYLIMTSNIRDEVGNSLQGNRPEGGHVISFTTGGDYATQTDWTDFGSGAMMPPFVMGVTPSDGSMNVVPNTKINITFSDPMESSSVTTAGNIKLYSVSIVDNAESTTAVSAAVSLDTTQKIATVIPTGQNLSASGYKVVVTGALKSANGIWMGDPGQSQNTANYEFFTSYFEVPSGASTDNTAPTVLGSWPTNAETGVAVNPGMFTIQFSEGMDPTSIDSNTVTLKRGTSNVTGSVNYDSMSQSASFAPSVVLAPSTDYTLTVVGTPTATSTSVTDAVGNPMASNYVVIFTTSSTGDTSSPSIMFANGDDYGIAITFSEAMNSAKITDTNNWPTSVLNSANYIVKWGDPATVAGGGTPINIASSSLKYDGMTNTIMIESLGLTPAQISGKDYYINMASSTVSGTGGADLSGNALAGVTNFQMPINNSADTNGMLGPMMGGMMGGPMGPDMGNMGMMMAGVFPMNSMAGQTTTYFVDMPTTKSIPLGGKIVLTFPTGFNVASAAKDQFSPINNDINEWNTGVVTIASVTGDQAAKTITIVTGGATTTANDFLRMDISGIINSSIPRGFETSGYTIDMKTFDVSNNLLETITGMPFFINEGGSNTLMVVITASGAGTIASTTKVFLGSPMTGPMEAISTSFVGNIATSTFSSLTSGEYMLFTDPTIDIGGSDYFGLPMPEFINISASTTKNITLTEESSGSVKAITVNITGSFGTDDIDIFASGPTGFRVKTIASAGTNPSTTLYLPDGDWMVGMGPAMPKGPMAGPPPMPDWMPPMPVQVVISDSGTVATESSGTANDGTIALTVSSASMQIVGYVKDDSNNAVADAEVFAYQPNGSGMGAYTKSDTSGQFTLKVAAAGTYSVGVFKPGLPFVPDKTVIVTADSDSGATDGNSTADITVDGQLITAANQFIFKIQKPSYTISGKVTDGTNPVAYAPVWAYQSDGFGYADTMTDASGNYIVYVDNGAWVLNAYIPGYGDAESQTVVVNGADKTQNLSPDSSYTYYTISGNVTIDGSAQTFMPIRAVLYNANGAYQGKEYGAMTDSAGDYSISAPAGIYRVDIWTPSYGEVERTDADDYANNPANVNLTSGNKSGVNIIVASIDLNTITLAFTNGISSQEGFVNIDGVDMTNVNNPMPTGFHQSLRVADLSATTSVKLKDGNYFFFLDVPGYGNYSPNASSTSANGDIVVSGSKNVTFDLPDTTDASAVITISGTVTASSTGLADAWVWIHNPSTGYNNGTQTATSGAYSLTVPVPGSGTYKMGAEKTGYMSAEPVDADLTDVGADGNADNAHDFALTAQGYTISGYLYADAASGGTANSMDSGEEVPNGWIYAEEISTGARTHTPADGTGYYSLGVVDGDWKVYGAADGYLDTQYSSAGLSATISISSASVSSRNIKLSSDSNWTNTSKTKPMTPASGGVMDDTGSNGTGVKITVPANALGSSNSAGNISANKTSAVVQTNSATPFAGEGKNITAADNSGQPITNLNDYIDIEMVYYKADIDAEVTAGRLSDFSKLKAMNTSYFDSSLDDWVNLPTTKTAYYSTSTEWITYKGDSTRTGFEKFIDDALASSTFTNYTDYKLLFKASANHLTIFGVTTPTDAVSPSTPSGLTQTAGSGSSVTLNWSDNSEADLMEYEIYRSASSGVGKTSTQINTSQVSSSSFTDSSASTWTSYYYTVTAADDSGNESAVATEIRACSNSSVSNGSVATDCTITCNSGYTQSGNSCIIQGGAGITSGSSNQTTAEETIVEEIIKETVETVEEVVDTAKEVVNEFANKIIEIASEAVEVVKANINSLLGKFGFKRDLAKEQVSVKKYVKALIKDITGISKDNEYALTNFISYGTPTTQILGEGERAGVVNSYKSAFGKLPSTEEEWNDIIKIGNGRWPSERNDMSESNATEAFKKIYLRTPDRTNPNDDAAVTVISYGLRPADRNLDSEKVAIRIFRDIYGYNPSSATAWDIVRAIAYSGATR